MAPRATTRLALFCAVVVLTTNALLVLRNLRSEQAAQHEALLQQQQLSEFEDLLGYGGLIHNFKNWVLRPDEDYYRDRAQAQADAAVDVLNQLEVGLTEYEPQLNDAYRTIEEYRTAVASVSELHQQRLSAEAIDREVRIDDTAALASIAGLRTAVGQSIQTKLDSTRHVQRLMWAVIVLSVVAVLALGVARSIVRRTQAAASERHASDMEAFTQIAAHDLKGPLIQIANLVNFIREDRADNGADADIDHHLDRIDDRVVRLQARVAGVFD